MQPVGEASGFFKDLSAVVPDEAGLEGAEQQVGVLDQLLAVVLVTGLKALSWLAPRPLATPGRGEGVVGMKQGSKHVQQDVLEEEDRLYFGAHFFVVEKQMSNTAFYCTS